MAFLLNIIILILEIFLITALITSRSMMFLIKEIIKLKSNSCSLEKKAREWLGNSKFSTFWYGLFIVYMKFMRCSRIFCETVHMIHYVINWRSENSAMGQAYSLPLKLLARGSLTNQYLEDNYEILEDITLNNLEHIMGRDQKKYAGHQVNL